VIDFAAVSEDLRLPLSLKSKPGSKAARQKRSTRECMTDGKHNPARFNELH
jgi:hypothetical protein